MNQQQLLGNEKMVASEKTTTLISGLVTFILLAIMLLDKASSPEIIQAEQKTEVVTGITHQLPDLTSVTSVAEKKSKFLNFLRPIVRMENQKILGQRNYLLMLDKQLKEHSSHRQTVVRKLMRLQKAYAVEDELIASVMREEALTREAAIISILKKRIDIIPEALVLAQAANESAWGTSRFAREANNLFGQWCFKKGCGLVPRQRGDGQQHEVRKFRSIAASVASYLKNLNTHPAYAELRQIRYQLRQQGEPITARHLLEGLHHYSERGEDYLNELASMIRVNRLE